MTNTLSAKKSKFQIGDLVYAVWDSNRYNPGLILDCVHNSLEPGQHYHIKWAHPTIYTDDENDLYGMYNEFQIFQIMS